MHVLVTGAKGQLGKELCRQLGPRAIGIDVDTLDITDASAVLQRMRRDWPTLVINCAAYTQVDQAEREPQRCEDVNSAAVGHLARACAELDCPLVQISTDYVFCGTGLGRPWREDDPPSPEGVYARTKRLGEQAAATWTKHWIVRTCGLYAPPCDPDAKNFVRTMLRLAESGKPLRVVNDQHCTPSFVPHVARAVLSLAGFGGAAAAPWGTYHVTNAGATTWFGFAAEIFRVAGRQVSMTPISTAEFGAPAPRPAYSVLDISAYTRLGGPPMSDWKAALAEYFADMAGSAT